MKYLYFSAQWCGPCKMLSPIMNEVSATIEVEKIDVDVQYEKAQEYGVRNIPTVVLIDNGGEVKRFIGVQPNHQYLNPL